MSIIWLSETHVNVSAVIPGSKVLRVFKSVIEDMQVLAKVESANDCNLKFEKIENKRQNLCSGEKFLE